MRSSMSFRNLSRGTNKSVSSMGSFEAKWITVFLNGDEHTNGLKCLVSNKTMKTLDSLLDFLTTKLQPKFGAVRNLYDLETGQTIFDIAELRHNDKYVAAGTEVLKKLDKWSNENVPPVPKKAKRTYGQSSLPVPSRVRIPRIPRSEEEPLCLHVYRNGDARPPPVRCIIPKYQLNFWDKFLSTISQKVMPETSYIKNGFRLCKLSGQLVNSSAELTELHQTYVAVGNFETFRRRQYIPFPDLYKDSESDSDNPASITVLPLIDNAKENVEGETEDLVEIVEEDENVQEDEIVEEDEIVDEEEIAEDEIVNEEDEEEEIADEEVETEKATRSGIRKSRQEVTFSDSSEDRHEEEPVRVHSRIDDQPEDADQIESEQIEDQEDQEFKDEPRETSILEPNSNSELVNEIEDDFWDNEEGKHSNLGVSLIDSRRWTLTGPALATVETRSVSPLITPDIIQSPITPPTNRKYNYSDEDFEEEIEEHISVYDKAEDQIEDDKLTWLSDPGEHTSRNKFQIIEAKMRRDSLESVSPDKQSPDPLDQNNSNGLNFDEYSPSFPYNIGSRAVVSVGSGNRRAGFYYTATMNAFQRPHVFSEAPSEDLLNLKLESDPGNIFHARDENMLTKHAQEIQESNDTIVDLPVEHWEAQEVIEEYGEDSDLENYVTDNSKSIHKYRSSTVAY